MAEEGKDGERDGLSPTARGMRQAQPLVDAVWRFIGGAVVGVVLGYLLDRWLGTGPWLLLALSVLGIGVGFYAFVVSLSKLGRKK
ncbi:MAG: AtpZ/AtpI family protein [Myxococcaceae bacterium]|nr:AtpZ/AtpI family protein [Myxococcaceae bacterium]MCI0671156.1 AtpZ/AtpI family protein [Myxococcaceae bacterium]